jgi:hypothetical protein
MSPITTLFLKLGLTRDSRLWLWSRVLAVATLVATGTVQISDLGDYVGLNISDIWANRIAVAAVAVLWLAGKYDTSALPGAPDTKKED